VLWGEIRRQGYGGSVDTVQRFIASLQELLPIEMHEQLRERTSGRAPQRPWISLLYKSPRQVALRWSNYLGHKTLARIER
jgi:hypothetical protein